MELRVKGTAGSCKAIIALSLKFLGHIYRTLKNNLVSMTFPTLWLA